MEIDIHFAGVRGHMSVLEEAKRIVSELKEMLFLSYEEERMLSLPNAGQLCNMAEQADRIERSIQKRMLFLEDLVCDLQAQKEEMAYKLSWLEEKQRSAGLVVKG